MTPNVFPQWHIKVYTKSDVYPSLYSLLLTITYCPTRHVRPGQSDRNQKAKKATVNRKADLQLRWTSGVNIWTEDSQSSSGFACRYM